jgi:hypothetical protein
LTSAGASGGNSDSSGQEMWSPEPEISINLYVSKLAELNTELAERISVAFDVDPALAVAVGEMLDNLLDEKELVGLAVWTLALRAVRAKDVTDNDSLRLDLLAVNKEFSVFLDEAMKGGPDEAVNIAELLLHDTTLADIVIYRLAVAKGSFAKPNPDEIRGLSEALRFAAASEENRSLVIGQGSFISYEWLGYITMHAPQLARELVDATYRDPDLLDLADEAVESADRSDPEIWLAQGCLILAAMREGVRFLPRLDGDVMRALGAMVSHGLGNEAVKSAAELIHPEQRSAAMTDLLSGETLRAALERNRLEENPMDWESLPESITPMPSPTTRKRRHEAEQPLSKRPRTSGETTTSRGSAEKVRHQEKPAHGGQPKKLKP